MVDDPLIGYPLGSYRVERQIGQGGMAQVYYGTDLNLQRPVAVKVIDTRYRDNPSYAQRLVQEARAVATWRHENILQVYAAGEEKGLYYFAMEFIDGQDLGQVMAAYTNEGTLMPHEDVVQVGQAIAAALDYAHQRQVIHRDVKPSNVMIARDGRIVLMDFGLALNLHQGSIGETFGTPHYIAPEQAMNSAQAVPESDLYALGIILYEMLTGVVPFNDPSTTAVVMQHINLPPPSPRTMNSALNVETEAVLLKALSKKPGERYRTGISLLEALEKSLQEGHSAVSMPSLQSGVEPSFLQLPPIPAGMKPTPPRPLSKLSVVEWVSMAQPLVVTPPLTPPKLTTPPKPVPLAAPSVAASIQTTDSGAKPSIWLMVGVGILLLLVAGVLFTLMGGNGEETAVSTPTPLVPSTPMVATEPTTEVVVVVTTTTATAEIVSAAPSQGTPLPTDAATPSPLSTDTLAPLIPTAAIAIAPTILYPNGRRVVLFYDTYSFYLWNATHDRISLRSIDFENIDANGNFAGYFFDGGLWTQFYSFVEDGSCMRIENTHAPGWLRPAQCNNYNASVTPDQDSDKVFWLPRPGVTQFRVLWDGQEIARCEVNLVECELFLP